MESVHPSLKTGAMVSESDILNSNIFIVDDEEANVLLLEKGLTLAGFTSIKSTTNSNKALEIYKSFNPQLVLLDLRMPGLDGFQVMEQFKEIEKSYLSVLVLTAENDHETCIRALKAGAKDFLNKPFDLTEISFRIRNLLEVRLLNNRILEQNQILEQKVQERTKELRAYHSQLLHSEKLSAVGKLAASISHEFNNPILGVRNILEQIRNQVSLNEPLEDLADLAISECTRVMGLASKLKQFYRPTSGQISSFDLHEAIEDMIILKKKNFREKNIAVEKEFFPDLPLLNAVEDQIKQVILNLLHNAEEAIGNDTGKISVTTSCQNSNLIIRVQDSGCGIPPGNLDQIFEPFFTTKGSVKGTGLGLSVSYGIIKRHGGDISCQSAPGEGTLFTVTLPKEGAIKEDLVEQVIS